MKICHRISGLPNIKVWIFEFATAKTEFFVPRVCLDHILYMYIFMCLLVGIHKLLTNIAEKNIFDVDLGQQLHIINGINVFWVILGISPSQTLDEQAERPQLSLLIQSLPWTMQQSVINYYN